MKNYRWILSLWGPFVKHHSLTPCAVCIFAQSPPSFTYSIFLESSPCLVLMALACKSVLKSPSFNPIGSHPLLWLGVCYLSFGNQNSLCSLPTLTSSRGLGTPMSHPRRSWVREALATCTVFPKIKWLHFRCKPRLLWTSLGPIPFFFCRGCWC